VLNGTWDDMEAETALRQLELPLEEQRKLRSYYLKLREEYRKGTSAPVSVETEPKTE
jgi:hypothetical protein